MPKAIYEALRRKYWGKQQEDKKAAGKAEGNAVKLSEDQEAAEEGEDAEGSQGETADKRSVSQLLMNQGQEDFAVKKMDQLKPYIYAKSTRVDTLANKAAQKNSHHHDKHGEGHRKST